MTVMSIEQQQLETTIKTLEAQRSVLGAALVDAALAPLRARLASLVPTPSLKQVTVLFLDVVGSTALSQQLDPEDVHSVMNSALASCTALVEAFRGNVLQYAGDSLLAAFGADEVREDDAERAVRCGLALLEEGRRCGELVLERYQQRGFNVRVGLHTGAVLRGAGVDGASGIRGFTVNVAARMEQSAPAGALRISHDTYRHVRGVFDVSVQPPMVLKGVAEPMLTYLVLGAKPRAFRVATRGIEGVETRMIGRDAELRQLQQAFERLYGERKLSVITVVGEAGVGKSRLLYEFENWAEARTERFYFFQGRAQPLTRSQPYGLLRDMLAWRLQIADSDSMEIARQKFEHGVAPLFVADQGADLAQAHAHLLGQLIGLDFGDSPHVQGVQSDSQQLRERAFHTGAQIMRRVAAQHGLPIVLLLDDLHHADVGSIAFLDYLCHANRDLPMLLLALLRPDRSHGHANWTSRFDAHCITLAPLDRHGSRELAGELLKMLPEVPAALRELVIGDADGNPFYMEELVKMLIDVGAIVTDADQWRVNPDKLLATRVPQTLTGVLQARLDGLHSCEKLALQQASVIGLVFWDQALAALDAGAPTHLPALLHNALIAAHDDASLDAQAQPAREYAFTHQILHQVTYDTLLKPARRALHAKAAQWLAGLSGARARDFLGATAEHFRHAGQLRQACEFFTRAAEHAAERAAHQATIGYVAQALALLDAPASRRETAAGLTPDHTLRWRLLDVRERTLDLQGQRAGQLADIEALQQVAELLGDDRHRAEVAWRRASLAMRTGDYHTMQSAALDTLALAKRAPDTHLGLRGQQRLALALSYLGDDGQARALAQQGLAQARELGARQLEALFLNALSFIADNQADRLTSLDMDQQDLLINRELGNRRNEAIALGNLGLGWLRLGELAQAQQHLEDAVRLARAIGDRATLPNTLTNLSVLALYRGDAQLALSHAQTALATAGEVQSPEFEAIALCALANARLELGEHEAAAGSFARAHALALTLGNGTQHDASAGLARVALASADNAAAWQAVQPLLALPGGSGKLEGTEAPYLIGLSCYRVLAAVADRRAPALLRNLHAELLAAADSIGEPALRHGFLHNVPEHCAITALHYANNSKP